jgi:hypothetical protein
MKADRLNFRIWNTATKQMSDPVSLFQLTPWMPPPKGVPLIWLQSTGITDNGGVEVFEGDVTRDKHGRWYKVYWSSGNNEWGPEAGWRMLKYNLQESFPLHALTLAKMGEHVIGNIYENPELLEKE